MIGAYNFSNVRVRALVLPILGFDWCVDEATREMMHILKRNPASDNSIGHHKSAAFGFVTSCRFLNEESPSSRGFNLPCTAPDPIESL
jgi:hypothetical protein